MTQEPEYGELKVEGDDGVASYQITKAPVLVVANGTWLVAVTIVKVAGWAGLTVLRGLCFPLKKVIGWRFKDVSMGEEIEDGTAEEGRQ
jgi:hypothetical protein